MLWIYEKQSSNAANRQPCSVTAVDVKPTRNADSCLNILLPSKNPSSNKKGDIVTAIAKLVALRRGRNILILQLKID